MKALKRTFILALVFALIFSTGLMTVRASEDFQDLHENTPQASTGTSFVDEPNEMQSQARAHSLHGTDLRPHGLDLGSDTSNAPALHDDVKTPQLEGAQPTLFVQGIEPSQSAPGSGQNSTLEGAPHTLFVQGDGASQAAPDLEQGATLEETLPHTRFAQGGGTAQIMPITEPAANFIPAPNTGLTSSASGFVAAGLLLAVSLIFAFSKKHRSRYR